MSGSNYIYEATEESRALAKEISDLKDAKKVIDERLEELSQRLVDKHVSSVDWVDTNGKRWYVRMQRTPKYKVNLKLLTAIYPQYVTQVTKLVEDRDKLNRLINNGIIDPEKVIQTTYSKPFPKVYEWKEGASPEEQE